MKILFFSLFIISSAMAQDTALYLKNFDAKIYSLKTKGVQDIVVDVENPEITKELNFQQRFGKLDEVIFRIYWTANPERMAIEVIGLPDGFMEVKEELKAGIAPFLEYVFPLTTEKKFPGYKFIQGTKPKEIIAQDTTGLAPVPSYSLKFDPQDVLTEIHANKPIGSVVIKNNFGKESFADGKIILNAQTMTSSEYGQTMVVNKEYDYAKASGMGVLSEISQTVETSTPDSKPVKSSMRIIFKNYKINEGSALNYFLGEAKAMPGSATKK
jgi:hypothetical protein